MTNNKAELIQSILKNLPSTKLEGLKKLFWEELNYDHENQSLPTANWDQTFRGQFSETPVLFASIGSDHSFHIVYCHLNSQKISISAERTLINELIKSHPHCLFVFSNSDQTHWHFVNSVFEKDENAQKRRILRRISVSPEDRLRTASERIALLDATRAAPDLDGIDPNKVQEIHEKAFDVEAVTEDFFKDYKEIFNLLKDDFYKQNKDMEWAHDYALQFMNRIMFLYYIERKRWIGNDSDFLHSFWKTYRSAQQEQDTFVSKWLHLLFFNAFNKPQAPAIASAMYLSEKYRSELQLAPWLNGGLFSKTPLDNKYSCLIKDELMGKVFKFLDRYNFTINEDTPLDQEVAVDPEMIGKVYESLVNVSTEADEKGDAGIFYTPRIEIDLMCRLSLVDWLSNNLPDANKNLLYEFVFAFSEEDKTLSDKEIQRNNLWPNIDQLLSNITVLDPACGSGSFLVGMLSILDDLLSRCGQALGENETPYERKKAIVAKSLYGVDIMDWAVHVAELRLWLQLVIDTEIDENERRLRPLLPNLSFKIRRGDSLVQEIGGMNLGLRRTGGQLRRDLAGKITALKTDKLDYFNNKQPRKFTSKEQVKHAEHLLFLEIVEEELQQKIKKQAELQIAVSPSKNLFGETLTAQIKLDAVNKQRELDQVTEAITKLKPALEILKSTKEIPFVWDVAFVEIFEGEKSGFDIVVGNPPYIRQEKIRDPGLLAEAVTDENKKAYKEKLAKTVYSIYPETFGFKPGSATAAWSLDKKSDYYIYFYFVCMSLLTEKGSFCFITSNSWLDVGYGADLQRFLLTRGKVKMIIDNQVKRSFKSADVNTVIALLAPPHDNKLDLKSSLDCLARFVMFKVPFENGLSPVLWEEVEGASERCATAETRIVVKKQAELIETGIDPESRIYSGDKWGGKYLRAPDLYWDIIEKNKDKFITLPNLVNLSYGIKPGSVKFFYISEQTRERFHIEKEYLKPVITSSQGLNTLIAKPDCYLLYCHEPLSSLKGTGVYDYIKMGEAQGVDRIQSVASHSPFWYSLSGESFDVLIFRFWDKRFWTPFSQDEILCSDNFFYGKGHSYNKSIPQILLNSTFHFFQLNIVGRTNQGQGVLTTYGPDLAHILVIRPDLINSQSIQPLFFRIAKRDVKSIYEELKQHDRMEFDMQIMQGLDFSPSDIDNMYGETIRLVEDRINKAESVK